MSGETRFFGKYRGIVRDTRDPLQLGRINVAIAALGITGWAMPCAPDARGLSLPPVDTPVWIDFEAGDPAFPVWTGFFWSADKPPAIQDAGDGSGDDIGT